MRYLAIAEPVDMGVMLPHQMAPILEQVIIPSIEAVMDMEEEGKIVAGGGFSGAKGGAIVFEATSNDEIHFMLSKLPFWNLFNWKVIPLTSFKQASKSMKELVEQMKTVVH